MPPRNEGYLGNNNLKRNGVQIEFTPDMIAEILKCKQDPIYFAEKYIKIVHVDHGLIPIKLYDYQKDIVQSITDNRRVTVCTSRQAGKTTTAVAIILHYVLFNEHKTVALLANKGDSAREILDRIQIAFEALPKWLQQGVVEWNKGSIELENGCKIIASATSGSAIRGKSISFLYIDETAFVENWDDFFSSVFPTISSGQSTKVLYTSTPNGLNHFYKTCEGAKEDIDPQTGRGKNGFIYIEVPWSRVPGRDEAWRQETLAGMDFNMEQFSQEFCCEFQGSSNTLIDGYKLKELVIRAPLKESNKISVYENPDPASTYVMVVDVSRGKGLDYSAFSVFDVSKMPYKQVCTFRDNVITPVDYAEVIYRIHKTYNQALLLIEVNDIGAQVSDILHQDFEVEELLFTESAGRNGKRISGGFGSNVDKGIRTTTSVKAVGCNILKMMIEQDQLIIHDFHTINELSKFSRKGKSYEAEPGSHDDLVMTMVLFAWLSNQTFFKEITDINTLEMLRQKTSEQIEQDLLPFGFSANDFFEEDEFASHTSRGLQDIGYF
jgi:hypothetical protein